MGTVPRCPSLRPYPLFHLALAAFFAIARRLLGVRASALAKPRFTALVSGSVGSGSFGTDSLAMSTTSLASAALSFGRFGCLAMSGS